MQQTTYKRIIQSGTGLGVTLLVSTLGFWFITNREYNLFECFYMTFITITTIGYNEVIDLHAYEGGRLFNVFVALAGISFLTYFITNFAALIIDGHIRESYRKGKMENSLSKLQGHYLICGISNYTERLIEELVATKTPHVFIDKDGDAIDAVKAKFPSEIYIQGDASSDGVLKKAGIERAKGVFAATGDDNTNLVISLSSKRLKPGVRVVSFCFSQDNIDKISMAGADKVVSPTQIGGLRMAAEMLRPAVTSFLDIMLRDTDKNLRVEEINLKEDYDGQTVTDLNLGDYQDSLLIAVKSGDSWTFNPKPKDKVKKGDTLIIITTPEEKEKLMGTYSIS